MDQQPEFVYGKGLPQRVINVQTVSLAHCVVKDLARHNHNNWPTFIILGGDILHNEMGMVFKNLFRGDLWWEGGEKKRPPDNGKKTKQQNKTYWNFHTHSPGKYNSINLKQEDQQRQQKRPKAGRYKLFQQKPSSHKRLETLQRMKGSRQST